MIDDIITRLPLDSPFLPKLVKLNQLIKQKRLLENSDTFHISNQIVNRLMQDAFRNYQLVIEHGINALRDALEGGMTSEEDDLALAEQEKKQRARSVADEACLMYEVWRSKRDFRMLVVDRVYTSIRHQWNTSKRYDR